MTATLAAGATGALAGAALGLMLANGELLAAVAACVLAALVMAGVRFAAPPSVRRILGAIVGLSFATHVAVATFIYFGSLAAGHGGFVTGDDAAYAQLSWAFARYLGNDPQPPYVPPGWAGQEYLFGTWVYVESAIFFLFGQRVLLPLLLNAALSAGLVLLVFDLGRRQFGTTAALVAAAITSFYPSLVLWSALNLKDALALFLIALCFWCLVRIASGARTSGLVGALAALILLESLRWYVFVGLAIIVPVSVMFAPRLSAGQRIRWSTVAALSTALLIALSSISLSDAGSLTELELTRQNMARDAETGFVDTPRPAQPAGDDALLRTLRHFPTGLAYTLFAPFPWALRRLTEWVTLPEMLLWYSMLAALPWTIWRTRSLWPSWSPLLLFVGGLVLIFALTEGNVGTLYRHRAMVIPFVAVLAAPTLVTVGRWLRARAMSSGTAPSGIS